MRLATALLATSAAHVCLHHPPQRAPRFDKDAAPGDHVCYRRLPDCHGTEAEAPSVTFHAGEEVYIRFQQNLNHWTPANPGYFEFSLASSPSAALRGEFRPLGQRMPDYPAFDMYMQTELGFTHTFAAHDATEHGVLQGVYVSENPLEVDPANNTDAIFYNWADVAIAAPRALRGAAEKGVAQELAQELRLAEERLETAAECVLPAKLVMSGTLTPAGGDDASAVRVVYDKERQMTRFEWPHWTTITDYTDAKSVKEYIITKDASGKVACEMDGADRWYDWGYGASYGMTAKSDGEQRAVFSHPLGVEDHVEYTAAGACLPLSRTLPNGLRLDWTTHAEGDIDASEFALPSECNAAVMRHSMH